MMTTTAQPNIEEILTAHKLFADSVDGIIKGAVAVEQGPERERVINYYVNGVKLENLLQKAISYGGSRAAEIESALTKQRQYNEQLRSYANEHGISITPVRETMEKVSCSKGQLLGR
jgi:hypothetical protein